jgi:Coenzyme PQQ synthesis protein D (PqqD)
MTLRRADRVFWRGAPGFLVLADGDGQLTEISGRGWEVWQELANPIEQQDLVAVLMQRYGVDRQTMATDLAPLVDGLIERGLIERGLIERGPIERGPIERGPVVQA